MADPRRAAPVLTNVRALERNPYLELWLAALERAGGLPTPLTRRSVLARGSERPALAHLQWPERIVAKDAPAQASKDLVRMVLLLGALRLRRLRVLLTMHNVTSHDAPHPRLERLLWDALERLTTDVHLLSAAGGDEVFAAHPRLRRKRRHVIPHGNYEPAVATARRARSAARAALGLPLDAHVVLTFGVLKGYKGATELLDLHLASQRGTRLLVLAGEIDDPALARRVAGLAGDATVRVLNRRLADDDLSSVICAADLVVLPYRRVLNSGSALLALTLHRPVVLPRTPTFEELASRVGAGWVRLLDEGLTERDLAPTTSPLPLEPPDLTWCDWSEVERSLRSLLGTLA